MIQNGGELNYSNLAEIEAVLFESRNNGEDRDIRLQHIENIRRKWNPQEF